MKSTGQSFFRRFFASRLFLLVCLVIMCLIALGYARAYYQDYKVKLEIERLQEEAKKLENKKLESMEILKYVSSPEFVENKARTDLNMRKPGENVAIIVNQFETVKKPENLGVDEKVLSNMAKWWYYFTHKNLSN